MKLVTYRATVEAEARLGVIKDDLIMTDDTVPVNTSVPATTVTLCAPIPRPRKNIWGIGLNYTEHVAESARARKMEKRNNAPIQNSCCLRFQN